MNQDYFKKLAKNSVRCLMCLDEIESKHRHDFVTCSCGNVSVDGGLAYVRRSAIDFSMVEDTSVHRKFTVNELEYEIHMSRNRPYYSKDYNRKVEKMAKQLLKEWYGV